MRQTDYFFAALSVDYLHVLQPDRFRRSRAPLLAYDACCSKRPGQASAFIEKSRADFKGRGSSLTEYLIGFQFEYGPRRADLTA